MGLCSGNALDLFSGDI